MIFMPRNRFYRILKTKSMIKFKSFITSIATLALAVNANNTMSEDSRGISDPKVKAQRILGEMMCTIPNDVPKIQPFLQLDWGDLERIQLAVKAIETLRRKDSEHNWNHAATSFYIRQMNIERFSGFLNSDREKLSRWMRNPERAQIEYGAPLDIAAEKIGSLYRSSCKHYIDELRSINKLFGEAKKISDKEMKSKGLMAKPLPCPVIDLPDCKP